VKQINNIGTSNLIYVVIIFLKIKNILIISISLFKKNILSKNIKDFSIFPYISLRLRHFLSLPFNLANKSLFTLFGKFGLKEMLGDSRTNSHQFNALSIKFLLRSSLVVLKLKVVGLYL